MHLRRSLFPLPNIESVAERLRCKGNFAPFGEIEHISLLCVHFLPRLVTDIELSVYDDLHLVVVVRVDKRCAFF